MTPPDERIETKRTLLAYLELYLEKYPDLRLGQVIANATYEIKNGFDSFYVRDEAFIEHFRDKIDEME